MFCFRSLMRFDYFTLNTHHTSLLFLSHHSNIFYLFQNDCHDLYLFIYLFMAAFNVKIKKKNCILSLQVFVNVSLFVLS